MNYEEWMLLYGSRIHNVSILDTVTHLILADKFPKRIHEIKIIISLSLRYRILFRYCRSCIQTFIELILWHFLSSMRVKLVWVQKSIQFQYLHSSSPTSLTLFVFSFLVILWSYFLYNCKRTNQAISVWDIVPCFKLLSPRSFMEYSLTEEQLFFVFCSLSISNPKNLSFSLFFSNFDQLTCIMYCSLHNKMWHLSRFWVVKLR